jgi:hypothetical protein
MKDGETKTISKYLENCTTLDCIMVIEGILKYIEKLKERTEIQFKTSTEANGDGWGGDYNFAGEGYRFLGNTDVLDSVMIKDVVLTYTNGRLQFPKEWINECEQDVVLKNHPVANDY